MLQPDEGRFVSISKPINKVSEITCAKFRQNTVIKLADGLPLCDSVCMEANPNHEFENRSEPSGFEWEGAYAAKGVEVPDYPAIADHEGSLVSSSDKIAFLEQDEIVRKGLEGFIGTGIALSKIREQKLWRAADFKTWEEYCKAIVVNSKTHANRMIRAAQTAEYLIGGQAVGRMEALRPRSEGQMRPLNRMPDNSRRSAAWDEAVSRSSGQPTAQTISEVVEEMCPKKASTPKKKSSNKEELMDIIERLHEAIHEDKPHDDADLILDELKTLLKLN